MTWTQFSLITGLVCAGFSALIAYRKGRSAGWFALAGLVLGVFGLLWAAFARSAERKEQIRRERLERSRRYGPEGGELQ